MVSSGCSPLCFGRLTDVSFHFRPQWAWLQWRIWRALPALVHPSLFSWSAWASLLSFCSPSLSMCKQLSWKILMSLRWVYPIFDVLTLFDRPPSHSVIVPSAPHFCLQFESLKFVTHSPSLTCSKNQQFSSQTSLLMIRSCSSAFQLFYIPRITTFLARIHLTGIACSAFDQWMQSFRAFLSVKSCSLIIILLSKAAILLITHAYYVFQDWNMFLDSFADLEFCVQGNSSDAVTSLTTDRTTSRPLSRRDASSVSPSPEETSPPSVDSHA